MRITKTRQILFILGCAVSIVYLIWLHIFNINETVRNLTGDSGSYLSAMRMLYTGDFHPLRPVGYPSFLIFIDTLAFSKTAFYFLTYVVQFLLWLVTIRLILTFFPDEKLSLGVILFVAVIINPSFVQYSGMILTEIVFLFLIVLGFVLLKNYLKKPKDYTIIGFLLSMLLATLVRPGLFYFSLIAIVGVLFLLLKNKRFVASILIVSSALLFFAWPMHIMQQTHGRYTLSNIDKITQYRYLNARIESDISGDALSFTIKKRDAYLRRVKEKVAFTKFVESVNSETKEFITKRPLHLVKAFSKNLFLNFHAGNDFLPTNDPLIGKHLYGLSRILNMVFVLLLLICLLFFGIRFLKAKSKNGWLFDGVLLFYCFYCWFTSGVSFYQGDRFNIVWIPILVIFMFHFFNSKKYAPV